MNRDIKQRSYGPLNNGENHICLNKNLHTRVECAEPNNQSIANNEAKLNALLVQRHERRSCLRGTRILLLPVVILSVLRSVVAVGASSQSNLPPNYPRDARRGPPARDQPPRRRPPDRDDVGRPIMPPRQPGNPNLPRNPQVPNDSFYAERGGRQTTQPPARPRQTSQSPIRPPGRPPIRDPFAEDRARQQGSLPRSSYDAQLPQQPPPTPSGPYPDNQFSNSQRTPIHFHFPAKDDILTTEGDPKRDQRGSLGKIRVDKETGDVMVMGEDEGEELEGGVVGERRRRALPPDGAEDSDEFASARRDPVTLYMSNRRRKAMVIASSSVVGMTLGAFLGKSTVGAPKQVGAILAIVFALWSLTSRGPYGEMSRALGLGLIFLVQRYTSQVRSTYPTTPHLKALVKAGPRKPFPPIYSEVENPWAYTPMYEDDVDFSMLRVIIAMTLLGTFCGGNLHLPLIPTWLAALAGASTLAFATTMKDPKGDLARTIGMKAVALVEELLEINYELQLFGKVQTVTGKIFDKLMVLDRKHRIKDKIVSIVQWMYLKVSSVAQQVQADVVQQPPRAPINNPAPQ